MALPPSNCFPYECVFILNGEMFSRADDARAIRVLVLFSANTAFMLTDSWSPETGKQCNPDNTNPKIDQGAILYYVQKK